MADVTPIEDAPRRRSRSLSHSGGRCSAITSASCGRIAIETLVETARRAGISPQYLSEIERGLKEPSSEMIAAVAGALESDLVDLTTEISRDLTRRASSSTAAASGHPRLGGVIA